MEDVGVRPAVARVMSSVGVPVGAAFLVTPNLLLTAAHVVSLAVGNGKHGTAQPDGEVLLNFAVAPELFLRAELVHWVPPGDATPEDIAGLRLIDPVPDGARPAPLTDLLVPSGRRVVTLGFPRDAPHGGWGRGQLADADGRALVQVDTVPDSQFTIEEGFSGTPVWDIQDGAVAGLIIEGWTRGRRSGFMIPTSMLLAAWPELAKLVWPGSPFRGLKSFTEHDSAVYFGRDELADRIANLTTRSPALTVIGASGVGKSSLIHAAVLPRLRKRAGLVVATMRPSQAQTPLRAVALALVRAAEPDADPLGRGDRVDAFADRLAHGRVAEVVDGVLESRGGERLLLVVDQFEEALVASTEEVTQAAAVLTHCLRPQSRLDVLSTLRVDFLGKALQHRDLARLVEDPRLVTVGELSQSELRAAITAPVRRTRMVRYDAGLVDRLLADVGPAAGRLPLLQFTLAMLWDKQKSGVLTHRAYDELGGIDLALAKHAEAVWDGLGATERSAASRLLVQLLYPLTDNRTDFVGRVAFRAQLDDAQWVAAQHLAAERARLVVVREQDSGDVAELAHDALVTHWRRLRELGEQDREFREWQEGLRQRIRSNSAPLAGADLRVALRWVAGRRADLAQAELSYVDISRRRRFRRWRRWTLGIGAAAAVGVLVLTQQLHRVADDAANAMIHNISKNDSYASLRTTLRAYRTSATTDSGREVNLKYEQFARIDRVLPDYTALPLSLDGDKPTPIEAPSAVAQKVSADGKTLVTTDPQRNITLWRVDGNRVTGQALNRTADRVTISRDGRYIAYLVNSRPTFYRNGGPTNPCTAESLAKCVMLYDTATRQYRQLGTLQFTIGGFGGEIPIIRFDPTGQVVAVVNLFMPEVMPEVYQQRVTTWETSSGQQRSDTVLTGNKLEIVSGMSASELDSVRDMWLAPGGQRLLINVVVPSRPGGRVLYDVLASADLTGPSAELAQVSGELAGAVAVSGDGHTVAAPVPLTSTIEEHPKNKLVVWDVATGRALAEVPALSEKQSAANVTLDLHGDRALLTDFSGEVSVLRVGDPTAPPVTLSTRHWQAVVPVGSGDDSSLVLAEGDVVGLALPTVGQRMPLQRLAGQPPYMAGTTSSTDEHPDQWSPEMTSMLASGVPAPNELTNLPSGAYTGPLGG